jgi:hypothetical protein
MKFNKIERRILGFIDRQYPIAWNRCDSGKMLAVGERPLPTTEEITDCFNTYSDTEIQAALTKLIAYQCVEMVYLRDKSDYSEIALFPGQTIRLPVAKREHGRHALQVTEIGKATIKETLSFKLLHLLPKIGARLADKYLP